ncbi:CARDB domain-containing protein [Haloarcula sp. Atlit-7R]|uniref:PKD domain-containing protein n=1 Tax=Haloarcula sp. Atlit-7R TaxID=2282125 RepID=UPI000EF14382|nr:CARDB domain-containing protein [Haloarcula sp. Atlit-7R]RLM95293.1 hypothetical protein D3D01_14310 [Haloarcula sp. Atlit-7R]
MDQTHALTVQIRSATAVVVGLALVLSVVGPVGTAAAAGTTAVTLESGSDSVAVNETTTFDVVVDSDGGVGAAELGIAVDDPTVASITDIAVAGGSTSSQTDVSADGASASIAYFGVDTPDSGDVTIVTVTLQGEGEGTTDVSVTPREENAAVLLFDESGAPYSVSSAGSTTLSVTADQDTNSPPTADAGDDVTVESGATVALDATGSTDDDGSVVSYEWTQTGGPTGALSDAATATPTVTAPDIESTTTLTYEVTVTDDSGTTDTDAVSVTVTPSDDDATQPDEGAATDVTLAPSQQSVSSGASTTVDVVLSDADGGVGAAEMSVSVDDPAIASITDVTVQGNPDSAFVNASIAADGSDVTVEYATADTANGDDVAILTLSLAGAQTGTAALSVDDIAVYDETGTPYEVATVADGEVTVVDPPFTVSALSGPETVVSGESETVSATVTNNGAVTATKAVTFTVDGTTVATESVTLGPGESTTVTFDLSPADLGAQPYAVSTVDATQTGEVTVTLPVIGSSAAPPSDPDSDGTYEDFNGDGTVDVGDVQVLFAHHEDAAVQQHTEQLDLNGDGTVDVGDVQVLFSETTS